MGKTTAARKYHSDNNVTIMDFADARRAGSRAPHKTKFLGKGSVYLPGSEEDIIDDSLDLPKITVHGRQKTSDPEENHYADYQIDVWFLISENIAPEDVSRFALICQKTRHVVDSAKFWAHLYRKYCNPSVKFPECYREECTCRKKTLRAHVIRSLFHMYAPLAARRQRTVPDPQSLCSFKCVGSWYLHGKCDWNLCFKFSRKSLAASGNYRDTMDEDHVVDSWEDANTSLPHSEKCIIADNLEEGNRILVVQTDRFHSPPNFLVPNLLLTEILQPLSQDLRTFKLELTFADYDGRKAGKVVYDPVKSVRIFRWWEPEYHSFLG